MIQILINERNTRLEEILTELNYKWEIIQSSDLVKPEAECIFVHYQFRCIDYSKFLNIPIILILNNKCSFIEDLISMGADDYILEESLSNDYIQKTIKYTQSTLHIKSGIKTHLININRDQKCVLKAITDMAYLLLDINKLSDLSWLELFIQTLNLGRVTVVKDQEEIYEIKGKVKCKEQLTVPIKTETKSYGHICFQMPRVSNCYKSIFNLIASVIGIIFDNEDRALKFIKLSEQSYKFISNLSTSDRLEKQYS